MDKMPRITPQTLKVLEALLQGRELAGADIAKSTGLHTGTLYPILLRLERAGLLASRWEEGDPKLLGRPRRRFYSVTGEGVRAGRAAARELRDLIGGVQWA